MDVLTDAEAVDAPGQTRTNPPLRTAGEGTLKQSTARALELRRRFCYQRWAIAQDGVMFTGASTVAVGATGQPGPGSRTPTDPDSTQD